MQCDKSNKTGVEITEKNIITTKLQFFPTNVLQMIVIKSKVFHEYAASDCSSLCTYMSTLEQLTGHGDHMARPGLTLA